MRKIVILGALGAFGCSSPGVVGESDGGTSGGDGSTSPDASAPPIPGLTSLRIEPALVTLVDDGIEPGERATFRAFGTIRGEEVEVTDRVAWVLEDPDLGAFEAGAFTSSARGGRSRVMAAAGDQAAEAELVVTLETVVIGEGVPDDAPTRFPSDTTGDEMDGSLSIVYPSDGTMLPRNLQRVTHQWVAPGGLDLFEVRFDSDFAHLRFYVSEPQLPIDPAAWHWLADTHAGGSVAVSVRGMDSGSPGTVHRSQMISELFSASEVLGALYYWSTGAQGVMRAHISAPTAELFYDDPESTDRECVSCHTVSRDGRRMAVAYGGERLREIDIADREVQIPADPREEGPSYGWGTFNPGATRLLFANKGVLTLLDADNGAVLRNVELPPNTFATHPDWSPDGRFVAVALVQGDRAPGNKDVTGSSLARIPVLADDTFGEPEILVASERSDDSLFFPSYSPDSRWIAYVRATGKSKDNQTSRLLLARADGSRPPIEMPLLNQRVRDLDGVMNLGNSMPTWAPSTHPDIFWLAFSSIRDYGWILEGEERDQLWGAAIDPSRAELGMDPSFPGFWMPFQQLDEGNHRAFWALADEDECPESVEICDGLDNDCDGIVDEMCCMPEPEICGNGRDDDCDGIEDEGCMCEPTENCTNGEDDDCDGLIDAADEDCIII